MSRLLVSAIVILAAGALPVHAQQPTQTDVTGLIEKQRRTIALDDDGCAKYPDEDEIVVCGTPEDEKKQRIFKDQRDTDENRLRRGEAVSTVRAACCSPIPKLPTAVGMGFGYVPPLMIPFEEVMKGLPDPEMIVPEGSDDSAAPATQPK